MYALLLRHINYFFRDCYSYVNRMCSAWNGCIVLKTKNRIDRCTNLVPVGRHHSQLGDREVFRTSNLCCITNHCANNKEPSWSIWSKQRRYDNVGRDYIFVHRHSRNNFHLNSRKSRGNPLGNQLDAYHKCVRINLNENR